MINDTGFAVTVEITGQTLMPPVIADGEAALLTSDGFNVRQAGAAIAALGDIADVVLAGLAQGHMLRRNGANQWVNEETPYDLSFFLPGTYSSGALMARVVFDRSDTLTGNDKYRYHIACITKNGGTLTFFKEVGDQANFGQVAGTNAIPSATTNAAIGNWNHTTDRNWHGWIDFIYLWNRVLDLGARRSIQNNPYQFVKPRLSGRTYVAYGITAPGPPLGDSGKGSIVIAIAS